MTDGPRAALLLGCSVYDHGEHHDLPAVRADLHYMQQVLERTDIGNFEACTVAETTSSETMHAIDAFLAQRELGETALVYFSGHGTFSLDDGQLYFVARDTDPADLTRTAVPAEFLNRCLQDCRATAKILLLDCCDSGSVFQAFATKGAAAPYTRSLPLPSGVFAITASDALQPASAMAPPGSSLGTSRFTGEIVEGLRTGRVKAGPSPWVTVDDLFSYLVAQMRRSGVPDAQRPTKSTLRATGDIVIARSPAGPIGLSGPRDGAPRRRVPPAVESAVDRDGPRWRELIAYYRMCLTEEGADAQLPLRDDRARYALLTSGPEDLQAGAAASIAGFGPAAPGAELWYGYPVVTLVERDRRGRARVRLAPLLMQRVEGEAGEVVLRPVGVVEPHPGVVGACLDEQDAAPLLDSWKPRWQAGHAREMVRAIHELLRDLGLEALQPLDPSALRGDSVGGAPRQGAHNAAVLLVPDPRESATYGVMRNLDDLAKRIDDIPGTALGALGGRGLDRREELPALVAPYELNESQEAVLRLALSRPLTVATGPPGTGKTQLVADLVATAVCAGQKVLVTSTNNRAVDEVAERCAELAPGLLIRTGNQDARREESEQLGRLARGRDASPRRTPRTIAGELASAWRAIAAWRDGLRAQATRERRLRDAADCRSEAARALGLPIEALASAWPDDDAALRRWSERAGRARDARVLGRRRRARAADRYARAVRDRDAVVLRDRVADDARALAALIDFADAERRLRRERDAAMAQSDDDLERDGGELAERSRRLSKELVQSVVAARVDPARSRIAERREALDAPGGPRQRTQLALMQHLGGWAITTHAMLQLRLEPAMFDLVIVDEASQCSIPAVLPLLLRAKRALMIGDPRQLRHVTTLDPARERKAREQARLSAAWLEQRRLRYQDHAAFHAAAYTVGAPLLLDEHYRCHPAIADVVNDACYDGRLEVVTDVRGLRRAPAMPGALGWEDVHGVPENRDGSWRNRLEAERAADVVELLLRELPADATVGVVTPFRAQARHVRDELRHRGLDGERAQAGTVHTFQGGQRDALVLSLVATADAPPGTIHWVASQTNLWNVAITRARAHLITIGDHAFWARQAGLPSALASASSHARPRSDAMPPADPLADLLHDRLIDAGRTVLERDAVLDGHRCDFVVRGTDGPVAVMLDPAHRDDEDAARHLRLMLTRTRLLAGLGAPRAPVARALRVPAWRVLSGESIADLAA